MKTENQSFKVGDYVYVKGNAVDTVWGIGKIEFFDEKGLAHISYGGRSLPEHARARVNIWEGIPVKNLELLNVE